MLFCCDECNCVDDTDFANPNAVAQKPGVWLCSACRPISIDGRIVDGEWHNAFPKEEYDPQQDVVCNRPSGLGLS